MCCGLVNHNTRGIRPFRPHDARSVAALHISSVTTGFISTLGPGFVAQLYVLIAASPHAGVWVAEMSGRTERLDGFIAGSTSTSAMYRSVPLRGWLRLLFFALPHVANPSMLRKAWETLLYGTRTDPDLAKGAQCGPTAELLSIAVAESA